MALEIKAGGGVRSWIWDRKGLGTDPRARLEVHEGMEIDVK